MTLEFGPLALLANYFKGARYADRWACRNLGRVGPVVSIAGRPRAKDTEGSGVGAV